MPIVSGKALANHPGIYPYMLKRGLPSKRQRYEARAMFRGGQTSRRGFSTIKEAEIWKQETEAEQRSRAGLTPVGKLTLKEYIEHRWWPHIETSALKSGRQRSPNTLVTFASQVQRVKLMLGHKRLIDLTPLDIEDFKQQMAALGVGKDAALHSYARLTQMLAQAVVWRLIAFNPATGISAPPKTPSRAPRLTLQQIEAILSAADGSPYGTFVFLSPVTGLGFSEEAALMWQDIDFAAATLTVVEGKTRAREATIALGPAGASRLQRHRLEQMQKWEELGAPPPRRVFTQPDGSPVTQSAFRGFWVPMREQLGLPWLHFHDLRHVTASLMGKARIQAFVMQDVMRHATPGMTRLYTQTDLTQQREAVSAVEELLGL